MELEINKTLVASISHISKGDHDSLEPDNDAGIITALYTDFGYLILVDSIDEWLSSKELIALKQIANKHDCQWLQLDRDGPILNKLTVFNW